MTLLSKNPNGCPYLLLAPMEGLGDRGFRKTMAAIGGFNEAVTEFLRVPTNAHVKSLALAYESNELKTIPLAAQLMGSDPYLMGEMAKEIASRGAPRIDLNCGCPSNRVTGRGAGSSLLKEPEFLHRVAKSMVEAVSIPVTIKMRSGYEDLSLFRENLLAAQESGVRFITLHPRTKVDGYGPPARWDLIAEAKSLLKIPLVGNGDILTVEDAKQMLKTTRCDALMIGRGSVMNPFIFHQIQAEFSGISYHLAPESFITFVTIFYQQLPSEMPNRTRINKLKQILSFVFKANSKLSELKNQLLTAPITEAELFLTHAISLLKLGSVVN